MAEHLSKAKKAKQDEFYTQYDDIQKEVNAYWEFDHDVFRDKTVLLPCDDPEWSNFTRFFAEHFESLGLKKLISTSYAFESKKEKYGSVYQLSFFESGSPNFDECKSRAHGKIFTLTRDKNNSGRIDIDDLEYEYLDGDGDFRSEEVKRLRDEADIIVTNPPFSLLREFIAWLMESGKKFFIIGNANTAGCADVFPLIKQNRMWLGATANGRDMVFGVPEGYEVAPKDREKAERLGYKGNYTRLGNACWFTNLEHGKRHGIFKPMTMAENLQFDMRLKNILAYVKYDNYDAIEVPYVKAIPKDCDGVMGVPITFLEMYNPEQFEILGSAQRGCHADVPDIKKYDDYLEINYKTGKPTGSKGSKTNENANLEKNDGKHNYFINAEGHIIQSAYQRIFIKWRKDK